MRVNSSIRISRRYIVGKWIVIGMLVYAFLYDNSFSLPIALGYSWTRLLEFPREIRLLDFAFVPALVFILIITGASHLSRRILIITILFVGVSCFSYFMNPLVSVTDFFRLTYLYILPALIFIAGRELPINETGRKRVFQFILIWVFLSALVSVYQYWIKSYPVGDAITGLAKDAHVNGNLFVLCSLILLSLGLYLHRLRNYLLALFFLTTLVLCSVLKTNIFLVFALALILSLYIRSDSQRISTSMVRLITAGALFCSLIGVVYYSYSTLDILSFKYQNNILVSKQNVSGFGPLTAHINALMVVVSSPVTFLIGAGPYSYANSISMGQLLEGGALSNNSVIRQLMNTQAERGIDAKVTLTSSILVEFGVVAFVLFVLIYVQVFKALWRSMGSHNLTSKSYAAGLLGFLFVFFMTSATTLFGSLDTLSISWPLMLLAGMTVRIDTIKPEGHTNAPIGSI